MCNRPPCIIKTKMTNYMFQEGVLFLRRILGIWCRTRTNSNNTQGWCCCCLPMCCRTNSYSTPGGVILLFCVQDLGIWCGPYPHLISQYWYEKMHIFRKIELENNLFWTIKVHFMVKVLHLLFIYNIFLSGYIKFPIFISGCWGVCQGRISNLEEGKGISRLWGRNMERERGAISCSLQY